MITVITGPPCSGKSTYLRQHAQPGDLTLDYDQLCQALGGTLYGPDEWLREVTAAAWAAAVTRTLTAHRGHQAWIIDARPRPDRLAAYQRAAAKIINLTASRDELHRRATADSRPDGDHDRIDQWFASQRSAAVRPRVTVRPASLRR